MTTTRPLYRIGRFLLTPDQLRRALRENMTTKQVERMIAEDRSRARIPANHHRKAQKNEG